MATGGGSALLLTAAGLRRGGLGRRGALRSLGRLGRTHRAAPVYLRARLDGQRADGRIDVSRDDCRLVELDLLGRHPVVEVEWRACRLMHPSNAPVDVEFKGHCHGTHHKCL